MLADLRFFVLKKWTLAFERYASIDVSTLGGADSVFGTIEVIICNRNLPPFHELTCAFSLP